MATTSFRPSHVVPAEGLDAWTEVDENRPADARLDPGLEVELRQRWGDWAQITCSNGWTAWVDGRRLLDTALNGDYAALYRRAEAAPTAVGTRTAGGPLANGFRFSPALLGGVIAVGGAVVPWVRGVLRMENAFGVSAQFLVDNKTTAEGGGFSIGLLVLVAAVAGCVFVVLPGRDKARKLCGLAVVLIPTMFVAQLQRVVSSQEAAGTGLSLMDLVNVGVPATAAGGLLLALGRASGQNK